MQLATITAAPSAAPTAPAAPAAPRPTWPDLGVDRPGGPDAPASADTVAQVRIMFPMNFGATLLHDVRLGARLERHATLDDARQGARTLAHGKASIGVVREQGGGFSVAELVVFDNDQMGIDPKHHKDMQLILGPDPARTRVVQSIHLLKDPGSRPVLEGLWIRGGNTFIEFDANGDGNVTFNHA